MSISIKASDKDEIPDNNIYLVFVRHVRRTTYDAVDLALGSYKTIEIKEDITIGKFAKSQRVSLEAKRFTPRRLCNLRKLGKIALSVRGRRNMSGLITAASLGLKVELDNGPR